MFVKATLNLPTGNGDYFLHYAAVVRAMAKPIEGLTAAFSFQSKNVYSRFLGASSVSTTAMERSKSKRETDVIAVVLDFADATSIDEVNGTLVELVNESGYQSDVLLNSLFLQASSTPS